MGKVLFNALTVIDMAGKQRGLEAETYDSPHRLCGWRFFRLLLMSTLTMGRLGQIRYENDEIHMYVDSSGRSNETRFPGPSNQRRNVL